MHVCMQIHVQTVIDLHLQSTSPAEYQLEKSVRESERKRKGERERDRQRERERERDKCTGFVVGAYLSHVFSKVNRPDCLATKLPAPRTATL